MESDASQDWERGAGGSGAECGGQSEESEDAPVVLSAAAQDIFSPTEAVAAAGAESPPRSSSGLPHRVFDEPYVVGIDEAGRGPVCGPLVYGIAYAPLSLIESGAIARAGADDSKKMSAQDRELVMSRLDLLRDKGFGYAVKVITAREISEAMLRPDKKSLNVLSYEAAAGLLADVVSRHAVRDAFVDLITPERAYRAYLERAAPTVRIVIKEKADATYPITGAASIVAKTVRDSQIQPAWGSGYPSDPNTRKYLQSSMDPIFGFPDHVRHSWSTVSKLYQAQVPPCRFFSELSD